MRVTVGTFNLNNLFSRWNFSGAIDELQDGTAAGMTIRYEFSDPDTYRVRTFRGSLVRAKDPVDTARLAERIIRLGIDVLAVQEVENVELLRQFNEEHLAGAYPWVVLVEGNDPRFIDVGLLSRLPVGAISSHQTAVHPDMPDQRVFKRDLLEVEIWDAPRRRRLLTLYNNHLKSRFVPFGVDPDTGEAEANEWRRRQAETVARIVAARQRPDGRFVILGDMNDPPDSPFLAPLRTVEGQEMVDGLERPVETRPPKPETTGPGPTTPAWTHRRKPSGLPPVYTLLDQIWLSPALAVRQSGAWIDRRTRHGGDGSDHDPAWVELDL